jgi:hypothetical protein
LYNLESVQSSLESKFGKMGGKIPIVRNNLKIVFVLKEINSSIDSK